MNAAIQNKQKNLVEKQLEVKQVKLELRQENRKEWLEQTKKYNAVMPPISCTSKVIDTTVKNFQGSDLGEIRDLVFNPGNGYIVYAIISFGGVFGAGDKLFVVPWRALRWTGEKTSYVLNMDKTSLKKAPEFDKDQWPDSSNAWNIRNEELNEFYGVTS